MNDILSIMIGKKEKGRDSTMNHLGKIRIIVGREKYKLYIIRWYIFIPTNYITLGLGWECSIKELNYGGWVSLVALIKDFFKRELLLAVRENAYSTIDEIVKLTDKEK